MKIKVVAKQNSRTSVLFIPLMAGGKLTTDLKTISNKYSLDYGLITDDFKCGKGETLTTYSGGESGAIRLIFVGLGEEPDYASVLKSFRAVIKSNKSKLIGLISTTLTYIPKKYRGVVIKALTSSAVISQYDLGLYKTNKEKVKNWNLEVISGDRDLDLIAAKAQKLADTQVEIMDLVNAPANKLSPVQMGNWAKRSGKSNGYKVTVLSKNEIVKRGLNALLSVNQGSNLPPAFIIAEYKHPKAETTVGLIGKGVTFDTGGLSIKGSASMHYMKSDMGGAAAVLGATEVAAKIKLPVNLISIIPATENSVDALSVKPGDIIESYSGKTIEVIDTDAEGRLILSDAIAYMSKKYKVDYMIDFATLTGSVIATLGYHAAGLFTKNNALNKLLCDAGDKCGERVWPLPLWEDYEEDLESDVADIKNYSGKPLAGAITAAKFLEAFTNDHPAWAHIDIAGTAFGDTEFGKQKNATGYGIELIISFLESLIKTSK